jgi:hypothetical protein
LFQTTRCLSTPPICYTFNFFANCTH